MKLISVIVFYSEKVEDLAPQQEKPIKHRLSKKETKLGSRILQLKYELANFPFGKETGAKKKYKGARSFEAYNLDPESQTKESGSISNFSARELNSVLVSPPIKLKSECCEKYLKGKRCGRCPCFDLPNGPASRMN